mmetsp:Transcript_101739/g.164019  ORF Transcript_101739/g.164019 Transcript_101739/m.164019 type:complete len:230 (-) Transcript_101739:319-1008(-)
MPEAADAEEPDFLAAFWAASFLTTALAFWALSSLAIHLCAALGSAAVVSEAFLMASSLADMCSLCLMASLCLTVSCIISFSPSTRALAALAVVESLVAALAIATVLAAAFLAEDTLSPSCFFIHAAALAGSAALCADSLWTCLSCSDAVCISCLCVSPFFAKSLAPSDIAFLLSAASCALDLCPFSAERKRECAFLAACCGSSTLCRGFDLMASVWSSSNFFIASIRWW